MSCVVAAYWPDGDWTLCEVRTMRDLFFALDSSGDPAAASIRLLPRNFWLSVSRDNQFILKSHIDMTPIACYKKIPFVKIHELVDKYADDPRKVLHTWTIKQVMRYVKTLDKLNK